MPTDNVLIYRSRFREIRHGQAVFPTKLIHSIAPPGTAHSFSIVHPNQTGRQRWGWIPWNIKRSRIRTFATLLGRVIGTADLIIVTGLTLLSRGMFANAPHAERCFFRRVQLKHGVEKDTRLCKTVCHFLPRVSGFPPSARIMTVSREEKCSVRKVNARRKGRKSRWWPTPLMFKDP